jgi:hypothetical protein
VLRKKEATRRKKEEAVRKKEEDEAKEDLAAVARFKAAEAEAEEDNVAVLLAAELAAENAADGGEPSVRYMGLDSCMTHASHEHDTCSIHGKVGRTLLRSYASQPPQAPRQEGCERDATI